MDATARVEDCPAPLSSLSKDGCQQTPKAIDLFESSVSKLSEVVRLESKDNDTNKEIQAPNSSLAAGSSCHASSAPMEDIAPTCSQSGTSTELKSPGVDSAGTLEGVSAIDSLRAPIPDFAAARQSLIRYKCDVCGRVCPSKHKLKRHLSTHSKERPFPCSVCGRSFKWTEYLQKHMRQQHSMTSKDLNEAEKSLPSGSKIKSMKSKSILQARDVAEVALDSNDSRNVLQAEDTVYVELKVQDSSTHLSGEDKDVSEVMNSHDSSNEVDYGPTKHSVSINVDMDAEEEQDSEEEEEDTLPFLESNDLDLNASSELHPPIYESYQSVESTNFFQQPQVSCIPTSRYSSLPISHIPSDNSTSTCFKPSIQYHQSTMAHSTQYPVSPFEAACSLLNSSVPVRNPQSNSNSNLPVSNRSFDYCLSNSYEPTQVTNLRMPEYCDSSHSTNTNFYKYQSNFNNAYQMDGTSTLQGTIQDCSFDSALQALTNSPQPNTTSVSPAVYSYYSSGQNQYASNPGYQVDIGLSTNYCVPEKSQFGMSTTTSLLQQSVSDSSTPLDFSDMNNVAIDSDFSSDIVEENPDSCADSMGIDVGIQCELGPETLQTLADEEEDDEKEEEFSQTQSDGSEGRDSIELQAPASDTIRSLLTEDRHVQKYPCRVSNCSKAYIYKKDVVRHMKIRHGITPQNIEAVLVETQEKPHICGVGLCRRSYYHLKDLKRHRRLCHQVSPCTSKVEKHPVPEEEVAETDDIGSTKYMMRFPCDFPGCLRSYVHKKDLVRHKRLYHNDATSKPSIPIPVKYTENELKHIRQRVKQEIETKVEKIRLDSTGSNTSTSTGSDEENVICISNEDLTSETKCTILLSSSSSLQHVKSGIDLGNTITGDLASLLGAIEQHGPIFRNC